MDDSPHAASIFSQKLDRIAFVAYFLGAVVPLAALGVVVERFALPESQDPYATVGLIGAVVSIGLLSLGAFFVLRRTARHSIERMDRDNARLASLLRVSSSLAGAQHGTDAAATATACALEMTGASAAFAWAREERGEKLVLLQAAGGDAEKLRQACDEEIGELAELVTSGGRPALRGPEAAGRRSGLGAAAAVPLPGEKHPMGALIAVHAESGRRFASGEVDALSTLAGLFSVALHNADLRHAQRNFFSHTTDILVTALDAHLGYQTGHSNRVCQYANRIGHEMGLDEDRMQRLHFGALLHDIGMLKLERSLQKNPKVCEKHAVLGYRMLHQIRLWEEIAPIVHHHHERWDGQGYPEGLAGEAIPIESRVIAVAEVFDTITSVTSYKVAMPFHDAVAEIEAHAGTQFDPEVVRAFRKLVDEGVISL